MKKFIFTILMLALSTSVFTLPVGNPADASLLTQGIFCEETCCTDICDICDPCFSWCDAWSLRVGFYGDYVFNRYLRTDPDNNISESKIRKTEIFTNAGYLALNFCDRIDIFTTLGATQFRIYTQESVFEIVPLAVDNGIVLETDTHFSWSIGLRGTLFDWCGFILGAEAQYFRACPDLNYLLFYENTPTRYFDDDKFKYHEWQVGLGLSYPMPISCTISIVPYAAIKGGNVCVDMDNVLTDNDSKELFDLESDRCVGYAVGMTLVGCSFWSTTLEGRFADEFALHFNTQFRF